MKKSHLHAQMQMNQNQCGYSNADLCREQASTHNICELKDEVKRVQGENKILIFTNNSISQIKIIMHKQNNGFKEHLKKAEEVARSFEKGAAGKAHILRKEAEDLKFEVDKCRDQEVVSWSFQ